MGVKDQDRWSGIQQILSIDSLVKQNKSSIDKILVKNNYDVLLNNVKLNKDTYIIDRKTGIGGIAILEEDNLIRIILGSSDIDDIVIKTKEFNDEYDIFEK